MSWSADAYEAAVLFAAERHQGQKFPGTELPYLTHVSMVTAEVLRALAEEPRPPAEADLAMQCAVLHDTIEDTKTTYEEIKTHFGLAVADGVSALTKNESLPKPEAMADSLARIQLQPYPVWLVKLADRIANLQAPPHYWTPDKCRRYQQEAQTIHEALAPASPYLADRLQARIKNYTRWTTPKPE